MLPTSTDLQPSSPLSRTLKVETAPLHVRAEAAMGGLAPFGDLQQYIDALQRLRTFHERWESATRSCDGLADAVPDLALRTRADKLDRDLASLRSAPCATASPVMALSLPQALGALYVLEGSTLGGRLILREVERTLGLTDQCGASFFAGNGRRTGELWRSFCEALDRFSGETDAVVEGANDCFLDFERIMTAEAQ